MKCMLYFTVLLHMVISPGKPSTLSTAPWLSKQGTYLGLSDSGMSQMFVEQQLSSVNDRCVMFWPWFKSIKVELSISIYGHPSLFDISPNLVSQADQSPSCQLPSYFILKTKNWLSMGRSSGCSLKTIKPLQKLECLKVLPLMVS